MPSSIWAFISVITRYWLEVFSQLYQNQADSVLSHIDLNDLGMHAFMQILYAT
jgi:hypothetical protein